MTRSRSSSPAPDVFPIYLFVYLFIYLLRLPRHRRRRHRLRLERLFASVANVCLEVGPSAVKHHRFFLEDYTAILSYLERDPGFRSSPEVGDASSKSSCRHFSLPWCTLYVNVKLSKACAELKITYQLYGLSIRIPIRKVRIAEPLWYNVLSNSQTPSRLQHTWGFQDSDAE